MRQLSAALVLVIAVASGGLAAGEKDELTPAKVREMVKRADLIILAEVRRVGKPPNRFSELAWVGQDVSYRVIEQWKGHPRLSKATVAHPIVRGGPDVVGEGRLTRKRFRSGARLIVLAECGSKRGQFIAVGSPLDYTPESMKLLGEAGVRP